MPLSIFEVNIVALAFKAASEHSREKMELVPEDIREVWAGQLRAVDETRRAILRTLRKEQTYPPGSYETVVEETL